jgi:uncharacterized protein YbjQ (UPF0145 family)
MTVYAIAGVALAEARDTAYTLKIRSVFASPAYAAKIRSDVSFFFGTQPSPPVAKVIGDYTTNRKTNSFGKPDEEACRWAMLSALLALRERAEKMDANAVINIESFYKKSATPSNDTYECHAGAVVALRGKVVKLKKK